MPKMRTLVTTFVLVIVSLAIINRVPALKNITGA